MKALVQMVLALKFLVLILTSSMPIFVYAGDGISCSPIFSTKGHHQDLETKASPPVDFLWDHI